MFRTIFATLAALSLCGCGGVLVYEHNDTVSAGPLGAMPIQNMKSSNPLESKGSFERIHYGLDKSGSLVGICRHKRTNNIQASNFDFSVHFITGGGAKARWNAVELGSAMDAHVGNGNFAAAASDGHVLCASSGGAGIGATDGVGASDRNGELILYVDFLSTKSESSMKHAVKLDAEGLPGRLEVVDIEAVGTWPPSRIVSRDNPLRGYTVTIGSNGHLRINGSDVELNGMPVSADSVKWQFD